MKSIETQGKTVDQAIELGLYKLGLTRDQVKITILEQAGLFNKARVKLSVGQASEAETELKTLTEELLSKMGLDITVSVEEQEDKFSVEGRRRFCNLDRKTWRKLRRISISFECTFQ